MIEEIQRLLLNRGLTFQESPFREQCQSDYWQSTVVDSARRPLASGFANERLQARKIAVSELLERETFREIKASDAVTRSAWGLDTHPTACGFAAGFNRENVIERSLGEAVERWVMSLWIDDGYFIPQIPSAIVVESLDPVSK